MTPLFGTHLGGTATANIWVTGALALASLVMWLVNGVRLGGRAFFAHLNPGPWWLAPLMVPLEIFGLFAKTFALAVRLFANMMAGHTVLAVLLSFILGVGTAAGALAGLGIAVPVVAFSVAMSLLELFVAVLQAFIFTFLTALFLGMFTVFHHGEEHAVAGALPELERRRKDFRNHGARDPPRSCCCSSSPSRRCHRSRGVRPGGGRRRRRWPPTTCASSAAPSAPASP